MDRLEQTGRDCDVGVDKTSTPPVEWRAPAFLAREMPCRGSPMTLAPDSWATATVASVLLLSTTMSSTGALELAVSVAAALVIDASVVGR